jgi:uncharacterized protein YdeI (YjbR/CyaY-like superfamily)
MTPTDPDDVTETRGGLPIVAFPTQAAWLAWLGEHHASSDGLWLKLAKKGSGLTTVSYAEALDVALCFGWIDSQKGAYDDRWWLQRFTRRGPRSPWSQVNRVRATELLEAGRIQPPGRAAIEAAQADGRWERAYAGQRTASVPDDLQRALDDAPAAAAFFAGLDGANRYAILYRIQDAKRPETRARRIETFVAMLARGEKLHP